MYGQLKNDEQTIVRCIHNMYLRDGIVKLYIGS